MHVTYNYSHHGDYETLVDSPPHPRRQKSEGTPRDKPIIMYVTKRPLNFRIHHSRLVGARIRWSAQKELEIGVQPKIPR